MQSAYTANIASSIMHQEIATRGKHFTDEEYMMSCFINVSKELFENFKNKTDILNKFESIPLSAKTVTDRMAKMTSDVTDQQIEDIKSASTISIAVDNISLSSCLLYFIRRS